jgi:hypothetical protein
MPDPLHWLGVTKIHKLVSMSNMKYDAIIESGITVDTRVPIPPELVPKDAAVEITAKVFEGYNGGDVFKVDEAMMSKVMGRDYDYKKTDAELKAGNSLAALAGSGKAAAAGNGAKKGKK